MRLAICDDDAQSLAQITHLIREYAASHPGAAMTLQTFENSEDLLEAAERAGGFDAYILDVIMPGINGIELGRRLNAAGYSGRIIYLTTSSEFAVDAFRVHAFDYLLKPVSGQTLSSCLLRLERAASAKQEKNLIVRSGERSIRLPFEDILYAKLVRRTIVYHLVSGEQISTLHIRVPFSQAVQELIRDSSFFICGASTVVSLRHITMVAKDSLVFCSGDRLYIPKSSIADIRSAWMDFWLTQGGSHDPSA